MIFGKKATVNNVALSMQKNKIKKTQKNIESIQQIDQKDIITKKQNKKDPEKYREYSTNRSKRYYNENKDKYKIYHKRSYYKKLSPEKQIKYKQMLIEKFPEIVDKIC